MGSVFGTYPKLDGACTETEENSASVELMIPGKMSKTEERNKSASKSSAFSGARNSDLWRRVIWVSRNSVNWRKHTLKEGKDPS